MGSVFFRQKKGGHAAVGFRDDPGLHARAERVSGQQTPAVLQAEFVLVSVVLVYFAPIACDVADEVGERVIPGCPECFQNTRSGHDRAGSKLYPCSLGVLECPLSCCAVTVAVNASRVDLVPVDLVTSEFSDEHRRVHGALLSGGSRRTPSVLMERFS